MMASKFPFLGLGAMASLSTTKKRASNNSMVESFMARDCSSFTLQALLWFGVKGSENKDLYVSLISVLVVLASKRCVSFCESSPSVERNAKPVCILTISYRPLIPSNRVRPQNPARFPPACRSHHPIHNDATHPRIRADKPGQLRLRPRPDAIPAANNEAHPFNLDLP